MNIQDRAKAAIKRITGNIDGAGVAITLIKPNGGLSFDIVGTSTKHHLSVDQETGELTNSMTASISFSEENSIAAGLDIRNSKGEVDLKGYHAKLADSTDVIKEYIITEWFPDEKLALIVCMLGYYEATA